MTGATPAGANRRTRWGTGSALGDDDEARRRLIAAAARCIARSGTAKIRTEDIAAEAGVSRMTLYRYFGTREEVILAVLLSRIDSGLGAVVRSLRSPGDAAQSIPELILKAIGLVGGDQLNEALFSADSRSWVAALEYASEPIVDAMHRQISPLLERWQADRQLHADLDLRETTRWINLVSITLMTPPWLELSSQAKREFLDRYLVRALVPARE
ncbi:MULTISPECIES: TetR/AcrR family transcriptional regulator [unclassified Frankia]|uniref:TetR/AcrR family transcriptional regulator n=1 Tax=unclassified Frankia TaxID=2632575 RepID=UPI0027DE3A3F|nr:MULTISPECIES: TetR/AcrR family transcriptional regulator [unclassified Frankia]